MSERYRQRRISETILRYRPAELDGGKHGVRDIETGQIVAGPYDDGGLARVQCRMLAAADIEALYMPDRATAEAKVAALIREHTDAAWAARVIVDYFEGSKA